MVALAAGLGGWIRGSANLAERAGAVGAGLLLLYPGRFTAVAGMLLFAAVTAVHSVRVRRMPAA